MVDGVYLLRVPLFCVELILVEAPVTDRLFEKAAEIYTCNGGVDEFSCV